MSASVQWIACLSKRKGKQMNLVSGSHLDVGESIEMQK